MFVPADRSLRLFDSHSHLDAPEFDGDRDASIGRARAAGVFEQLVPATDCQGWPKLRDVCQSGAGLYPAFGLHPMLVDSHLPGHLDLLREWIERERPVAVGECGLDFFIPQLDPVRQRFYFRAQLEIARECKLPVIVHARRAVEEVIATVRSVGGLTGVVHSYPGSEEQARQLYELGFMLGIGGPVTYERARRLRRLVAAMPLDRLLLETDSPDQPGSLHRGQRNEPARIAEVLDVVAGLRGADPAEIAVATSDNARRLLGLC